MRKPKILVWPPKRPKKCKRGHNFTEKNPGLTPDGQYHCKACRGGHQRKRKKAQEGR